VDYTVPRLLKHEAEMQQTPGLLAGFAPKESLDSFEATLEKYRGKVVWGYGASAKSTVLLNAARNAEIITAIVDDHTGKQGMLMPGVRTPIVPPQDLAHVDALVVLAWNWEKAICAKAEAAGFQGTYLIPFAA
jgi:hypothetical protein